LEPGSAFNLRNFPHDQRERFISSITRGKNQIAAVGRLRPSHPQSATLIWRPGALMVLAAVGVMVCV
jgi:hypothetical protein